jgi:hypothetical protein
VFVKQPKVRIAKYLPLRSQIDGVYPWRIVVHSIVIVRDIKYFPLRMVTWVLGYHVFSSGIGFFL